MEVNRKSFGKENSSIISKPKGKTLIPLNAKKFGTENKPVVSTTNKPTIESTRNKQLEPVNKLPLRSIDNSKKMIPRSIQGNLPSLSNKSAQPPTELRRTKSRVPVSKFIVNRDPPELPVVRSRPVVPRGVGLKALKPTIHIPDDTEFYKLFGDDRTSIYSLPVDCLITIFKLLQDTTSLRIVSNVCQNWRRIAQEPYLWRDIYFTQMDLNSGMMKINANPQFEHIRKLTIDSKCTNKLKRHIESRTVSPFKQLEILQFDRTSLNDIAFITLWINHVSTVNCQNIPVDESGTMHMPNFSFLTKLNHFKLQFSRKCSLKLAFFFNEPDVNNLPSSLESLELINVYDEEENWISRQDVLEATAYILMRDEATRTSINWKRTLLPVQIWDIWLKLEDRLVLKYMMLASLPNLKRLSLDRISSFTARIWNECLLPCSSQLTFVSFKGWHGDRESPRSIIRRVKDEEKEVDVEQALSRFISSLSNIKEIVLDDFVCTVGLIQGLKMLDKEYTIDQTLEDGKKLSNCKITIKSLK